MFTSKNTGKIIITVGRENEKLNSRLQSTGMAKKPEVLLTTLLINFISCALEQEKDPKEIIDKNLNDIVARFKSSKKL